MKNKSTFLVLVSQRLPLFLLLAMVLGLIGSMQIAMAFDAVGVADELVTMSLTEISERTGLVASRTAISPACVFDSAYQAYLCPEMPPASRPQRDPLAAAAARELLQNGVGLLLIPDWTNDRVMAFDPLTGDLVDADFIPSDPTNLSSPKSAILSASGATILVSDQLEDVVQEYDLDGNYLGVFAPAGGPNTAILDNILGIALRPNGNLLVTVTGGTNQDSVAEFDTSGNYIGNFVANGSGGIDGPFDVYQRTADWLVPGITSDNVNRYDLNSGAFITQFVSINNFPEQVNEASNSNVLIANFLGTQEGVIELTASGALVGVYNPAALGGYRGVYELPNGNILTTTGSGVHEIDRLGNLVQTKISGVSAQYIDFAGQDLAPAIVVSPDSLSSSQYADVQVTQTLTISNTGDADLIWDLFEDGTVSMAGNHAFVSDGDRLSLASVVVPCDGADDIDWVSINPISGTVPAMAAVNLDVIFDSTSYAAGVYTGTLCVNSNDAVNPIVTVPLTMTVQNRVPVAVNDVYTTTQNMVILVPAFGVLANDFDEDGDVLTAVLSMTPTHGMLDLNSDGSFAYTPTLGFEGGDSFTYYATDAVDVSEVATVTITVLNLVPLASNDVYSTTEGITLTVAAPGVLLNDEDSDGDVLTAVLDSDASHGTLLLHGDGSFDYIPAVGFVGEDSFMYHVNDGTDNSEMAVVTITITAAPVTIHRLFLPLVAKD